MPTFNTSCNAIFFNEDYTIVAHSTFLLHAYAYDTLEDLLVLHMHTHIYIHTYIHTYMHTYTYTYIHA